MEAEPSATGYATAFEDDAMQRAVRYDPESRQFSVHDFLALAAGLSGVASVRLLDDINEHKLLGKDAVIGTHLFQGERQTATPVADFPTLCCLCLLPHLSGSRIEAFLTGGALERFARLFGAREDVARVAAFAYAARNNPYRPSIYPRKVYCTNGLDDRISKGLLPNDSRHVAEERMAALWWATAPLEIEERRIKMVADRAAACTRAAKDADGAPEFYVRETKARIREYLNAMENIGRLARECLQEVSQAKARRRKRREAWARGEWLPEEETPECVATEAQLTFWSRSEDGAYCFRSEGLRKEYERLIGFPFELNMSAAARHCEGAMVPPAGYVPADDD